MPNRKSAAIVGALAIAAGILAPSPAHAAPTRYEAESATLSQATVATNHTGFSGSGFVDYANVAGSWAQFTVTAASAGTATLNLRYANGSTTNRPMTITVNGAAIATASAFTGTGSWDTWATKTFTASVTAGTNTIRATATTADGGPNVDFLDFEVASAATTEVQAENATISQGVVESNHAGFTGSGFVNYDNVTGGFVEFSVMAAATGQAALTFRYANGTTVNRPMAITVNGTAVSTSLAFNGTGDWDTWADQVVNASLAAGTNTIRATATTANGGPNLDRLRIGPPSTGTGPTAAQLLSKVTSCTQISNGRYKTDEDVATATIPVCQKTGAVFWQGDMDIDCDGVRTTQCNENTDCCFLPETFCETSTGGFLNAAQLPYVVVPSPSSTWDYRNFNIGCGTVVAVIFNNQVEYAVVGDTGPTAIIGEASYATANDLGINPDPSNGGTDSGVTYIVFQSSQRVSPIESHSSAITLGRQLATSFVADN